MDVEQASVLRPASAEVVDGVVAQLTAAVDALQAIEPGEVDRDELGRLLVEGRQQIERAEAAWSQMVERFDVRAGWKGEAVSMKSWLRSRCRMAPGTAAGRLRSARRLRHLPGIAEAYAAGRISTDHVAAITRTVTDDRLEEAKAGEGIFLEAAEHLDPKALGEVMAYWRAVVDPDGTRDDHDKAVDARRLSVSPVGEGTALDGWHDPEGGEVIQQAIRTQMARDRRKDDPRRPEQRRADALVGICEQYLQQRGLPRRRGQLYAVNVTVSWETLQGSSSLPARLEYGGLVPSETARRLACDADVARILVGPDGRPLDVGRRCRTATPEIWKALVVRDGGCVYPGCDAPIAWLEAHHLIHWAFEGPTCLDNFALVCPSHHHAEHEGGCVLAVDIATRRWAVHCPDGTRIVAGPEPGDYVQPILRLTGADPPRPRTAMAGETRGRYDPTGPGRPPSGPRRARASRRLVRRR